MYVEQDCTVEHEGQTFEAGGAVVTPEYAIGYVNFDQFELDADACVNSWHGKFLGHVTSIRKFRQFNPSNGDRLGMYQIYAYIDGTYYTGRTTGPGMIWKGKRVAKQ